MGRQRKPIDEELLFRLAKIGLPNFFIHAFTDEQDKAYDPFGGSGSTLIACEKTRRRCFMMELSPAYVDVIRIRWELATGKKAVLSV